ncbi:hypothetical protein Hanom_Chr08g00714781 [Helianthus anomalus]
MKNNDLSSLSDEIAFGLSCTTHTLKSRISGLVLISGPSLLDYSIKKRVNYKTLLLCMSLIASCVLYLQYLQETYSMFANAYKLCPLVLTRLVFMV